MDSAWPHVAVPESGVRMEHEGIALWYGTPDAPAPATLQEAASAQVVVGVQGAKPGSAVQVRYRMDGGADRTLSALLIRADQTRNTQYFRARFPGLRPGQLIEYEPLLVCAGALDRAPLGAGVPRSSFRVAPPPRLADATAETSHLEQQTRFEPHLEYIASVAIHFEGKPQIIGETPDGLRVNYYAAGGIAVGPRLNAEVLAKGSDAMIVRSDGIGEVRVRASLQTKDGGMIAAEYQGVCDFGPDGYGQMLAGKLPDTLPVCTTPRFFTGHPTHLWMNRAQFVGLGRVHVKKSTFEYDLFAVSGRPNMGATTKGLT